MSGNPGRDELGDSQNLPRLTAGQGDDLERLIDRYGLNQVLEAISDICHRKADYIQSLWQDEKLAKAWEDKGLACRPETVLKRRENYPYRTSEE